MSSRCISRYTKEEFAQHFGNGRNKFYIEFCCGRPCPAEINRCAQCLEKSPRAIQSSRRFEHGNVCDPIPDDSHIYGGKWYHDSVKKYGAPAVEIIEFALSYQREARGDFVVEQPDYEVKDRKHVLIIEDDMPRAKKTATEAPVGTTSDTTTATKKSKKKPQIVTSETVTASEPAPAEITESVADKPKRGKKKPQIAAATETVVGSDEPTKKKATGGAGRKSKKTEVSPYASLMSATSDTSKMVYKEVTIPTHLESNLEEFDTDGYEIEYVKLSLFDYKSSTYFRDSTKNKLYKKIKENGIGEYVGRYNPDTDSILSDIPDSDDEREN
jgi:hypothetical protein